MNKNPHKRTQQYRCKNDIAVCVYSRWQLWKFTMCEKEFGEPE